MTSPESSFLEDSDLTLEELEDCGEDFEDTSEEYYRLNTFDGVFYPETDGEPWTDNSIQLDWILQILNGLGGQYDQDPNVAVHGDLFWYPVRGEPTIVTAPDIMVIRGVPKQSRSSYRQWMEGNVVPQVVFEIRSPGNTRKNLTRNYRFYRKYGVLEFYLYDPLKNVLKVWCRSANGNLVRVRKNLHGWVSPFLQIRFEFGQTTLQVFGKDNQEFISIYDYRQQFRKNEQERILQSFLKTQEENQRIVAEQKVEEIQEKLAMTLEKQLLAEKRHKEEEAKRKEEEAKRLAVEQELREQAAIQAQLVNKLRELGIDPDTVLKSGNDRPQ